MSVAIIRDNILQLFFILDLIDISTMTRIPKMYIWQSRNLEVMEAEEEEGKREEGRKKKDEATGRKGRSSPSSRRSLFVDIGRKGKANE